MKKYVALKEISFEGLKGKPVVKVGDLLPDGVPLLTIKDLLDCGDIRELDPPAEAEVE